MSPKRHVKRGKKSTFGTAARIAGVGMVRRKKCDFPRGAGNASNAGAEIA
jgi:hypothetical protein